MATHFSDIDSAALSFNAPSNIKHGAILNTKDTFRALPFQLPPMKVKFGPAVDDYGGVKLTLDVTDPDLKSKIKDLDNRTVDEMVEHSETWFKKKLSKEIATDRFSGLLNDSNPKYNPLMKVKLNSKDHRSPTEVYKLNDDGKTVQLCSVQDVREGDTVTVIVKFTGLFVGTNGKVYAQLVADEMLVEGGDEVADIKPYTEVDPTIIQYKDPIKMDNGGSIIYTQHPVKFTLPEMTVQFPVREPERENQCKKIPLNMDDTLLQELCKKIDNHNIDTVVNINEQLFGSTISREVAESRYTPIFKQNNPMYPPLLNVRLVPDTKKSSTVFVTQKDDTGEQSPCADTDIAQGMRVTVDASIMGLCVINKNVYPMINATKVIVHMRDDFSGEPRSYAEVDPTTFQYEVPRKMDNGVIMIFPKNRTKFVLPKMVVKFPMREPEREGQCKKMPVEVDDDGVSSWFQALDEHNRDTLVQNGEKWINRPISREMAEEFYNPVLKQSNPMYSPLVSIRLRPESKSKPTVINVTTDDKDGECVACDDSQILQDVFVTVTASIAGMCIINKNVYPMIDAEVVTVHSRADKRQKCGILGRDLKFESHDADSLSMETPAQNQNQTQTHIHTHAHTQAAAVAVGE